MRSREIGKKAGTEALRAIFNYVVTILFGVLIGSSVIASLGEGFGGLWNSILTVKPTVQVMDILAFPIMFVFLYSFGWGPRVTRRMKFEMALLLSAIPVLAALAFWVYV